MQINAMYQEELLKPSSFKEITDSLKIILLSNLDNSWDYIPFTTEETFGEDTPIMQSSSWISTNIPHTQKHLLLKNILYKSKDYINYYLCNCHLKCEFSLKGESTFWLFLRAGNVFTIDTAVITIAKKENSQNCYISMGTFVEDVHKNLIFKVFTKQQLLDYSKKTNEIKNDTIKFKLNVIDKGEENISGIIYMNDSDKGNKIHSEFFLPVIENFQVIIGGAGKECVMRGGYVKAEFKEKYDNLYLASHNQKGCDCCTIV
jgi:hypothetical protein